MLLWRGLLILKERINRPRMLIEWYCLLYSAIEVIRPAPPHIPTARDAVLRCVIHSDRAHRIGLECTWNATLYWIPGGAINRGKIPPYFTHQPCCLITPQLEEIQTQRRRGLKALVEFYKTAIGRYNRTTPWWAGRGAKMSSHKFDT